MRRGKLVKMDLTAFHNKTTPILLPTIIPESANQPQPVLETENQILSPEIHQTKSDVISSAKCPKVDSESDTSVEEKLPFMDQPTFIATFLHPIQSILNKIRVMHRNQGAKYHGKKFIATQEDRDERSEYAKMLIHTYDLRKKMLGYNILQLVELEHFIIENRANINAAHPMNQFRFCPDEEYQCLLFNQLGWCDLNHLCDLNDGDIVYTEVHEVYEHDSKFALVMVQKNHGNLRTLFLSQVYSEEKSSSFFDHFSQPLKHVIIPAIDGGYNSQYEILNFHMVSDFKSKMICKFTELVNWIKSFYKQSITFEQCSLLYKIGLGENNFLNLMINGKIPKNILSSFLSNSESIKNHSILRLVTMDLLISWTQELGFLNIVWNNLYFLCIRQNINFKPSSSSSFWHYKSYDLSIPSTLEEVKSAAEIRDYLLDVENKMEQPICAPFTLTTKKYNYFNDDSEIFQIIIQFYLRSDGTEDLATLDSDNIFSFWLCKKEEENRLKRNK